MLNEYNVEGKISALPSFPGFGITEAGERIVFDPRFLGEYLFGRDTRHNKFILRSGYMPVTKYSAILKRMILLDSNILQKHQKAKGTKDWKGLRKSRP